MVSQQSSKEQEGEYSRQPYIDRPRTSLPTPGGSLYPLYTSSSVGAVRGRREGTENDNRMPS